MKCPICGEEIADDSRFCEFCGAKINVTSGDEKKDIIWWGVLVGVICVVVGIGVLLNFIGSSKQVDSSRDNIGITEHILGDQYIYEGLYDVIQENHNWNSTSYIQEEANYKLTNVYYNDELLLQILPIGTTLSISIQVQPSKINKFKTIKSFSYFEEDSGWPNYYYANCYDDVSLTAKIASEVLQDVFDVPHGAILTYSDK